MGEKRFFLQFENTNGLSMHAKSIKDHRFQQASPESVIDNGFIQMSRAPKV